MSALKSLGAKLRRKSEPSTVNTVLEFLQDLRAVSVSLQEIIQEMETKYTEQVIQRRPIPLRPFSLLPDQLKPPSIRLQDQKLDKIKRVNQRVKTIIETLDGLEESVRCIENETDEELLGRRIYELIYPNQPIYDAQIDQLNAKVEEFEATFLTSLDELNQKMSTISLTLSDFADTLKEQGVLLEQLDEKIETCNTKLDEIQIKLIEISKKLTNRTLIALIAGIALGALIVSVL